MFRNSSRDWLRAYGRQFGNYSVTRLITRTLDTGCSKETVRGGPEGTMGEVTMLTS
jgi:hypothetical protein